MSLGVYELQPNKTPRPGQAALPHIPSQPLIEYCTNAWQRDTTQSVQQSAKALPRIGTRSFRRRLPSACLLWLVICLIFGLCIWARNSFKQHTGPEDVTSHANELATGLDKISGDKFGHNKNVDLDGVTQLGRLDTALLPGGTGHSENGRGRRLIFIGDIHGCIEELTHLLAKSDYDEALDHIVTTGDMVNKGPSSGAVLDFLQSHHASCVRGNHDDRILLKAAESLSSRNQNPATDDPEMALARSLTSSQLAYLSSCPVILQVGEVSSHRNLVVVHAGLVPSLNLVDQDPWAVMNMRVIHEHTHVPSKDHERHGYVPWAELWSKYQVQDIVETGADLDTAKKMLHSYAGTTVVYGHDAKRGLQLEKHTKGLDSGCVKGRKLTALIISDDLPEQIVSVKCKQYV